MGQALTTCLCLTLNISDKAYSNTAINPRQPSTLTAYSPPAAIRQPDTHYKVEFIIVAARHGSRSPTNSRHLKSLRNALESYSKQQTLTSAGQQLYFELKRYLINHQHSFSSINARGKSELFSLAERLPKTYPAFFVKQRHFIAYSSGKKRTQQSMYAFNDGLARRPPFHKTDTSIFQRHNDPVLRFFNLYQPYLTYLQTHPWHDQGVNMINANDYQTMIKRVVGLFVKTPRESPLISHQNLNKTTDAELAYLLYLYWLYLPDKLQPENSIITSLFTVQEISLIVRLDNLKHFYKDGPGYPHTQVSFEAASAFIIFLNRYLYQVATGTASADGVFFFGHNETLLPIITFLNINNVNKPQVIFDDKHWVNTSIIPMAGNISWVVLSKNNKFFIQLRLNEKPVALPELNEATRKHALFKSTADKIYPLADFIRYTEKRISGSAIDFGELAQLYRLKPQALIDSLSKTLKKHPAKTI